MKSILMMFVLFSTMAYSKLVTVCDDDGCKTIIVWTDDICDRSNK